MGLLVEYRSGSDTAVVRTDGSVPAIVWLEWCRIVRDAAPLGTENGDEVELPWYSFLGLAKQLRLLKKQYGFSIGYSEQARELVQAYASDERRVDEARQGLAPRLITEGQLRDRLLEKGWDFNKRELKDYQVANALDLINLAYGADFSVPGAGKTTVALAVTLSVMPADSTMLVVAPKNAFSAWDQVLRECLSQPCEPFVRLGVTNGSRGVRDELARNPKRALISYGQLARAQAEIADFVSRQPTHMILDESHRIKGGEDSASGNAALLIGHLAVRRDILSGTPMPNSLPDLANQFEYLWPAHGLSQRIVTAQGAREAVGSLYVRTKKSQLLLPPVQTTYASVPMSDAQKMLYGLLRDDVLVQLRGLNRRFMPATANASVMRLLQAAIDPQAAALAIYGGPTAGTAHADDLRDVCRLVVEEDISPRMGAVLEQAKQLIEQGKKVVIWAPFRRTVERLNAALADLGYRPQMIHGDVPAGDEDDPTTREGIIFLFKTKPEYRVIVANPAAGGEGISLHSVCHDALYVGRTYNAAHYLQSRDRIHRLGLAPEQVTTITVFEAQTPRSLGSIDMSVRQRLDFKVAQMDAVFNDPDLRAIQLESATADPTLDDGLTREDLLDLFHQLGGRDE
jgi:SNF2 family DNA or RNA helicase